MESPNTPPTNGDRKVVYESPDNPVVRERGADALRQGIKADSDKKFLRVYMWMGAIMVTLFVPPDDRLTVLKQIPAALIGIAPASPLSDLLHWIF